MVKKLKKLLVILEASDACGKTSLANHLQKLVNGKFHLLHSNYSKELPGENNYLQHVIYTDFVIQYFNDDNYTGNNLIIFDRSYISDIVYGHEFGCGSKGSYDEKLDMLDAFLKRIKGSNNVDDVILIYCDPGESNYDLNNKEELLNETQTKIIKNAYDKLFYHNLKFKNILAKNEIINYVYNFNIDSNYDKFDKFFNNIKYKKEEK